jgi:NDP-4-keto-2,6-dideoxyhexose 3-C-methyltransferase
MEKLLTLGSHYVSDFIRDGDLENRKKYSLDVYLDRDLGAARLCHDDLAPPDSMWGQYWYRSGINTSMTRELESIVREITNRVQLKDNDIWLDIACNDGTLLKFVPDHVNKVGIDPCDDSYYKESSQVAHVVQDYFNYNSWLKSGYGDRRARVITCIAMFYDLDDPNPFVADLYKVLDDDGVCVLQMSYTPLMIRQLAFDNICHEHVYYYDLTSIKTLFERHNFRVVDCSLNDTNGGSFRIYLQKQSAGANTFASAPLRDVCAVRVKSILEYERWICNIRDPQVWQDFGARLELLKQQVVDKVLTAVNQGQTVYGYGASTKGNTLLQYFGLDHTVITAIAERSPYKYGLKTIGSMIPIVSEADMRSANPDYLLILPWHFIDEFEKREQDYIQAGGQLIVPCPVYKVISK